MEDSEIQDDLEKTAEDSNKRKSLETLMGEIDSHVELVYGANRGEPIDYGNFPDVTVVINFSERGFGFGQIAIRKHPKGVFVDTECMSLDRVKRYLASLLDGAVLDTDDEASKHKLYNEVMGRRCGEGCPVCKE
jgi:hypothetical protein